MDTGGQPRTDTVPWIPVISLALVQWMTGAAKLSVSVSDTLWLPYCMFGVNALWLYFSKGCLKQTASGGAGAADCEL